MSSFLLLIEEKKQKKIKASAEAGEAVRVHEILCYVPGKLRRRPQPPFLDVRKESKENQGVRDAGQVSLVRDVYSICFLFFVFRLSSFLALMQEKNQKKIKASGTPANLAWYVMCTRSAFYFSSLRYSSSSSSSSSSTVTFSGSSSLGVGSTV